MRHHGDQAHPECQSDQPGNAELVAGNFHHLGDEFFHPVRGERVGGTFQCQRDAQSQEQAGEHAYWPP